MLYTLFQYSGRRLRIPLMPHSDWEAGSLGGPPARSKMGTTGPTFENWILLFSGGKPGQPELRSFSGKFYRCACRGGWLSITTRRMWLMRVW